MAELFSQYSSGTQFTAGTIVGSALGTSGLNPVIDRLNSISTSDNLITGSLISGTNTQIYGSLETLRENVIDFGTVLIPSGTNQLLIKSFNFETNDLGKDDMVFLDFSIPNQFGGINGSLHFAYNNTNFLNGSVDTSTREISTGFGYTGRISLVGTKPPSATGTIGIVENCVNNNTSVVSDNYSTLTGGNTLSSTGSLIVYGHVNNNGSNISMTFRLKRIRQ